MASTPGNAIDISTTGVVYFNASVFQSIAPGATGTVLTSTGPTAPTWQALPGSLTLGTFGSTPNANGGTISGTTLTLQPAGTGFPGGLSVGSQSISGVKTFNATPIFPALSGVVTSDGASGLVGSTIAQHGALIAGATNAIISVSPSTAGFVLTSNGVSADPTFQANSAISGIVTINGSTGSVTGSAVTINAGTGNGTLTFQGSGTTLTVVQSTSGSNTGFGTGSLRIPIISGGADNSAFGVNSLNLLSGGNNNSAFGYFSGSTLTSGDFNCFFGFEAGENLINPNYDLLLGSRAGENYTSSESSNILLNNQGVLSESNSLRIGSGTGTGTQQLNKAFIAGINGVTSSSPMMVTINSTTDQLGVAAIPGAGGFTSIIMQFFTTSATYHRTSGMQYCIVECVAGGGGGGGSQVVGAATNTNASGGGGGGGYARSVLTAATVGTSQAVSVGVGGAGHIGVATGTSGGASGFGTLVVSTGGTGGSSGSEDVVGGNSGGAGGSGLTGDVKIAGGDGGGSAWMTSPSLGIAIVGTGGNSYFGGSNLAGGSTGSSGFNSPYLINGTSASATSWGVGGTGSICALQIGNPTGGNGGGGIVIVTEFIS